MNGWWVHSVYNHAGGGDQGFIAVASWVVVVIGSITLHELAHGWAALWEGDGTPRELGHMTGNPLVHMGSFSLLLFAVLGIAFGMMPVNPSRFRHGHAGRIIVAAAGPLMNLVLFVIFALSLGALARSGASGPVVHNVAMFLNTAAMLNVVLAVLNLIPLPPLDGWRILEGCHWRIRALSNHPQAPIAALFVLMVLFMSGFGWIWSVAEQAVMAVAGLIAG